MFKTEYDYNVMIMLCTYVSNKTIYTMWCLRGSVIYLPLYVPSITFELTCNFGTFSLVYF